MVKSLVNSAVSQCRMRLIVLTNWRRLLEEKEIHRHPLTLPRFDPPLLLPQNCLSWMMTTRRCQLIRTTQKSSWACPRTRTPSPTTRPLRTTYSCKACVTCHWIRSHCVWYNYRECKFGRRGRRA